MWMGFTENAIYIRHMLPILKGQHVMQQFFESAYDSSFLGLLRKIIWKQIKWKKKIHNIKVKTNLNANIFIIK